MILLLKRKKLFLFFFFAVLPVCVSLAQTDSAFRLYQDAESLFNQSDPTTASDSLALQKFLAYTRESGQTEANARYLMDAYHKAAILRQTYGYQQEALDLYQKSIAVGEKYELDEALLFQPYLYAANALYFLKKVDASVNYLKNAERILENHPQLNEVGRLFNSLGVIYFDLGNYQQSINYFSKAIEEIKNLLGEESEAVITFKSNIASALRHLHQYDSAISIYRSLIPYSANQDELFINLGTSYLDMQQADSALVFLNRVNSESFDQNIILHNKIAQAYYLQQQYEQAEEELKRAIRLAESEDTGAKGDRLGFTYKLMADIATEKKAYDDALQNYQQAIINYDTDFDNLDIFSNPESFEADFTTFALFDALVAKAECWVLYYHKKENSKYLKAALDTYESAFRMSDYVIKVLDNEDARLLLSERIYAAYQDAVVLLVDAYELTGEQHYLEKALGWSEKSKANTLAVSLKENQIKAYSGLPDSLLRQERKLRQELSRLLVRLDNARAEVSIQDIKANIRDKELSLSRLQDRFYDYPEYYRQKFAYDSLNIDFIRNQVLDDDTGLLTYFHTQEALLLFVLEHDGISYFRLSQDTSYYHALDRLEHELRSIAPGSRYRGHEAAQQLYRYLISPAEEVLKGLETLIIVPHDRLYNIPFEVLVDTNADYLLQNYALAYQFAATFLQTESTISLELENSLAVAPFSSPSNTHGWMSLPASLREIEVLAGVKLSGEQASKQAFLEQSNDASLIHLATHAVADSDDPSRSFIAFYPHSDSDSSYKLFAHELYNVSLSQTQLAVLSACETLGGKLVRSEGIMSLSRAFAYAGCPNMVTSLWQAEDNATAFITGRFYAALADGKDFAQALRLAKLDFLAEEEYTQFHTPAFWANLIYIGMPGQGAAGTGPEWWWTALPAILLLAFVSAYLFLKK